MDHEDLNTASGTTLTATYSYPDQGDLSTGWTAKLQVRDGTADNDAPVLLELTGVVVSMAVNGGAQKIMDLPGSGTVGRGLNLPFYGSWDHICITCTPSATAGDKLLTVYINGTERNHKDLILASALADSGAWQLAGARYSDDTDPSSQIRPSFADQLIIPATGPFAGNDDGFSNWSFESIMHTSTARAGYITLPTLKNDGTGIPWAYGPDTINGFTLWFKPQIYADTQTCTITNQLSWELTSDGTNKLHMGAESVDIAGVGSDGDWMWIGWLYGIFGQSLSVYLNGIRVYWDNSSNIWSFPTTIGSASGSADLDGYIANFSIHASSGNSYSPGAMIMPGGGMNDPTMSYIYLDALNYRFGVSA